MTVSDGRVLSSITPRLVARLIDLGSACVALVPLSFLGIGFVSVTGIGVAEDPGLINAQAAGIIGAVTFMFVAWTVFETWGTARGWGTPGKQTVGLHVVDEFGAAPGWGRAIVRMGMLVAPLAGASGLAATPWFGGGGAIFLMVGSYHIVSWTMSGAGSSYQDRVARTFVLKRPLLTPASAPTTRSKDPLAPSRPTTG